MNLGFYLLFGFKWHEVKLIAILTVGTEHNDFKNCFILTEMSIEISCDKQNI